MPSELYHQGGVRIKRPIKGMVTPGGFSLDLSKLIISIILHALWVWEALGDILTSIVSNSHFGKRSVARDITIFGFYCLLHVTNNACSY